MAEALRVPLTTACTSSAQRSLNVRVQNAWRLTGTSMRWLWLKWCSEGMSSRDILLSTWKQCPSKESVVSYSSSNSNSKKTVEANWTVLCMKRHSPSPINSNFFLLSSTNKVPIWRLKSTLLQMNWVVERPHRASKPPYLPVSPSRQLLHRWEAQLTRMQASLPDLSRQYRTDRRMKFKCRPPTPVLWPNRGTYWQLQSKWCSVRRGIRREKAWARNELLQCHAAIFRLMIRMNIRIQVARRTKALNSQKKRIGVDCGAEKECGMLL